MKRLKLILTIPSLAVGGAERVAANLANVWVDDGHAVTILTWDNGRVPPFFSLNPQIVHQSMDIAGDSSNFFSAFMANFRRIRVLRDLVCESRPDYVISFLDRTNITTVFALMGTGIPVIAAERSDPRANPKETLWRLLRSLAYPFASALVVQTEEAKNYFSAAISRKTAVIHNPVAPLTKKEPIKFPLRRPAIVSVGRLDWIKGYDVLLRAIVSVHKRFPQWMCYIVGDGKDRASLEVLRDSLGLSAVVQFLGQNENPASFLDQADLFVCPSRVDGFPNALCEAMAAGLPVISAATAGAAAIVRDDVDGILVPADDADALAAAISVLLADDEKRKRLAEKALEIQERFSAKKAYEQWSMLFKTIGGA